MASIAKLREKLQKALHKHKFENALELYQKLEKQEPNEPRWPHRHGDLLRRLEREHSAIEYYERAVRLYSKLGFVARAAAMTKVILEIDPTKKEILNQVEPNTALELRRKAGRNRPRSIDHCSEKAAFELEAPVLKPADDADVDEIRFLDVDIETEEIVELSLSKKELQPRELSQRATLDDNDDVLFLDLEEEPDRLDIRELAELPSMSLFAEVPPNILSQMIFDSELLNFGQGEKIIKRGDPSDALFVIIEGHAEVLIPGRAGVPPIILGEGDVAGETCLLDDVERAADVLSIGVSQVFRIPKTSLDRLVAEYPPLGNVLLELLGRRLISNMLQTSPIFTGFDTDVRTEIAAMFELRRAEEGLLLVKAGKRSDALYCTLLGDLELSVGDERRRVGPGIVFGQRTLLSREPSKLDVRCATDMLLLRLPARRFTELAALYPPVLVYLSEVSASAETSDPLSKER